MLALIGCDLEIPNPHINLDWPKYLGTIAFIHNTCVHPSTGYSPWRLRHLEAPPDVTMLMNNYQNELARLNKSTDPELYTDFSNKIELYKTVRKNTKKNMKKYIKLKKKNFKRYKSKQSSKIRKRKRLIHIGSKVNLRDDKLKGMKKKLKPRYFGPFRVVRKSTSGNSFELENPKTNKTFWAPISRIKLITEPKPKVDLNLEDLDERLTLTETDSISSKRSKRSKISKISKNNKNINKNSSKKRKKRKNRPIAKRKNNKNIKSYESQHNSIYDDQDDDVELRDNYLLQAKNRSKRNKNKTIVHVYDILNDNKATEPVIPSEKNNFTSKKDRINPTNTIYTSHNCLNSDNENCCKIFANGSQENNIFTTFTNSQTRKLGKLAHLFNFKNHPHLDKFYFRTFVQPEGIFRQLIEKNPLGPDLVISTTQISTSVEEMQQQCDPNELLIQSVLSLPNKPTLHTSNSYFRRSKYCLKKKKIHHVIFHFRVDKMEKIHEIYEDLDLFNINSCKNWQKKHNLSNEYINKLKQKIKPKESEKTVNTLLLESKSNKHNLSLYKRKLKKASHKMKKYKKYSKKYKKTLSKHNINPSSSDSDTYESDENDKNYNTFQINTINNTTVTIIDDDTSTE